MAGKGLKNHVEFDYCTSNPAFNIATENNLAGTGGNTTLYKTATNHAFQLLKPHGALMNITLKGIVNVLVNGKYKDYQTHYINLMDDIDAWRFNTCFFISVNFRSEISSLFLCLQMSHFPHLKF